MLSHVTQKAPNVFIDPFNWLWQRRMNVCEFMKKSAAWLEDMNDWKKKYFTKLSNFTSLNLVMK